MAVPGVNLAGYLDAGLGLGEAARQVAGALEAAGALVAPLALTHASAPPASTTRAVRGEPVHDTTLVCTTPEGMPAARDELGPAAFEGRRVIGLWWWEVHGLPGRWARSFDGVDEVWAGSRFVADVLGAVAPVPVVRMALPVAPPLASAAGRAAMGLPEEAFLFGFVFDHASGFARKNPLGLIEAFAHAFPADGRGPEHLVVKAGGGERHPEAHAALLAAAAAHPRVHVLEGHMVAEEKNALIARLDCYVSLHRSEGFGLTIAEAMLLGVPVVATDFGGSRDLVTAFTGWPVDWRAQAIGPGHAPYPPEGTWAAPDVEHAAAVLRQVRGSAEEAARRAARACEEVGREHAPAAAGAAMVARLATLAGLPIGTGGVAPALDLAAAQRRVREGPQTGVRTGARGAARHALLRALRPYATHQRLVDEELLRALVSLDERVRALGSGQQALAAELRRLGKDSEDHSEPGST